MKAILRIFAFVGALGFGWVAFADEEETEAKTAPEEPIQVVCPINNTEENCDTAKPQPDTKNPENE